MEMYSYDENDYEELLNYIIELLGEFGADHIIEQIEALEKLSLTEEIQGKDKKHTKYTGDVYEQIHLFDENDADKKFDVYRESVKNDAVIGEYITRQMTFKEMFLETMKILETYWHLNPYELANIKLIMEVESQ